MMCPPITPAPALFLATPAQAPVAWTFLPVFVGAYVIGNRQFLRGTSADWRLRLALLNFAVFILLLFGLGLLAGIVIPWQHTVLTWYEHQNQMLSGSACLSVSVDNMYCQAQMLATQLAYLALASLFAGTLLGMWRAVIYWRHRGPNGPQTR
jgi:hypothetical protein